MKIRVTKEVSPGKLLRQLLEEKGIHLNVVEGRQKALRPAPTILLDEVAQQLCQAFLDSEVKQGRVSRVEAKETATEPTASGGLADWPLHEVPSAGSTEGRITHLEGKALAAAKRECNRLCIAWRVVEVDGELRPHSADHVPNRVNLAVKGGVVTRAWFG